MSGILPTASGPNLPGMATTATQTDKEKLHVVAKQFEALFLREMLGAARKTSFGGGDEGGGGGAGDISGGQGMDTFRQMQDDHFADATADRGTIGLAKILEAQMARFVSDGSGGDAAKPDGK
jgi:flagellar protein FlgJ